MRLATWNVNGLRAIAGKNLQTAIDEIDPDVLLLQETKVSLDALPDALREPKSFLARYGEGHRKGYSGVAIWTRFEPDEWIDGLGDARFDAEGRAVSARFADLVVTSAYFPNSQDSGARLDFKLAFNAAVERFLTEQRDKGRRVVIGGDFNVAHADIDIARPEQHRLSPGFLPQEREWFTRFLGLGYRDVWREQHREVRDVYSWWEMRTLARQRNLGWRIDYFCVDEASFADVRASDVLMHVDGSDHCPVTLDVRSPK